MATERNTYGYTTRSPFGVSGCIFGRFGEMFQHVRMQCTQGHVADGRGDVCGCVSDR